MSQRAAHPVDVESPQALASGSAAAPTRRRVGVLGATGYAGQALLGLLRLHPMLEAVVIPWRTPGELDAPATATHTAAAGETPRPATSAMPPDPADPRAMLAGLDAIAVALPSEASALWVPLLLELGVPRVLDLSDHYRGVEGVHYGLPELFGAPPANARLVANPGCYPTAALLPLVPLLRAKLVDSEGIAVVGASGASGAGKGLAEHLHFCNLAENVFPYKVGTHRHVPEIERHATIGARSSTATGALSDRPPDAPRDDGSGPDVSINFVTQLLPIVRGMLVTTFVRTEHEPAALLDTLHAAYEDAPWISVVDHPDQNLGVRHVVGTHQAVIGVGPARRSGIVPLFCSIDNLMRGASSQALHNLNLWLGLPPGTGLPSPSPPPTGVPVAYAAAARSTDRDAFT